MTRPRQVYGANPPGRLPAAMLRALAAEVSDPGRFSRAKGYARDAAVVDIEVEPGRVRAEVQGSRYEPYVAVVHVAPADDTASLLGLIPDRDELMAECTCPDDAWGGFCKHAVATLLVLADEVTAAPEVLEAWRSGDPIEPTAPADPPIDVLAGVLQHRHHCPTSRRCRHGCRWRSPPAGTATRSPPCWPTLSACCGHAECQRQALRRRRGCGPGEVIHGRAGPEPAAAGPLAHQTLTPLGGELEGEVDSDWVHASNVRPIVDRSGPRSLASS